MLNGIFLRIASVALFSAMSAVVHSLSQVPVGQIIFWRSSVALIPIVIYMLARGQFPEALRTRRPRAHLVRGVAGGVSMMLSFYSLLKLPVANATALSFLGPLISLPAAAWLLKETLNRRIVWAALLGFAGVLLMLGSALAAPDEGQLAGILAGLGFATTMGLVRVQVRDMTRTERAVTIAFYFSVVCTAMGLVTLAFGWVPVDTKAMMLLAVSGLLGGLAQILATEAAARVPVSQLAPFDYTAMIWALGLDAILFSVMPDAMAFVGMAAIVAAGAITVLGSRAIKPKAAPPAPRQPWH